MRKTRPLSVKLAAHRRTPSLSTSNSTVARARDFTLSDLERIHDPPNAQRSASTGTRSYNRLKAARVTFADFSRSAVGGASLQRNNCGDMLSCDAAKRMRPFDAEERGGAGAVLGVSM